MWADWAYRGVGAPCASRTDRGCHSGCPPGSHWQPAHRTRACPRKTHTGEEGEPERLPLEQQQRFLLGLKSLVLCVALQRAGALAGALLSRREWRAGWREGVRSRLPGEVTLRSMLATLAHQPLAVVVVAPFALLLETVLPHTLSYPFLFDALTHDELRRILLSPFLAVPMLIGGVQGLLALDHGAEEGSGDERRMLSAGGVLARVRALATGLVTACYAGLFEELAFRWLGQPVAMALVYVVVAAGAPMDALLGACGLKLSLPVGAYPFELLGLGLSALSLGLLDLAIRLISAERSCAPAPQAALDLPGHLLTHALPPRPAWLLLSPRVPFVFTDRYGVYLVDLGFTLAHWRQGALGMALKPVGTTYKRKIMARFGFPAAVVAHIVWDAWLMAGGALVWLIALPVAIVSEVVLSR